MRHGNAVLARSRHLLSGGSVQQNDNTWARKDCEQHEAPSTPQRGGLDRHCHSERTTPWCSTAVAADGVRGCSIGGS